MCAVLDVLNIFMNLLTNHRQLQVTCSFFTSEANMKLMTFLADVLFCFSQFQQRLQKDSATAELLVTDVVL